MSAPDQGRRSTLAKLVRALKGARVQVSHGLAESLAQLAADYGASLSYREIDPDVFGEELARPVYRDVDRIALVAAVITAPR